MRSWSNLALALATATPAAGAVAQQAQPAEQPTREIVVNASRSVELTPDHAIVHLGVVTRDADAARAAEQHARAAQGVRAALRNLGFPAESLPTIGYLVQPEYERDRNRPVGYTARSTLEARVHDLTRVGRVIDAALGAGANQVTNLMFESTRRDAARLDALVNAVRAAREEAEVIARAAGGRLGGLLEANTGGPIAMGRLARTRELAFAADTPIEPGAVEVTASVTVRWEFLPNP